MDRVLQIHLTDKCNLKCKHCYQEGMDTINVLNIDDFTLLMEQFKELEIKTNSKGRSINITGGEPLMIPNILEYIDIAIDSGIEKINFLTNGILLNEEILIELKKRKIIYIQVSLEGNQEINDFIRGKGTYNKILQNIKLASQLGIFIKVSYTLNALNYNCIKEAINAVKEAGANRIWFDRVIPFNENLVPPMTSEQFNEAMSKIKQAKLELEDDNFEIRIQRALQFLYEDEFKGCYACSGVVRSFTIMPDGTVYPCRRMPINLGNFKTHTLLSIFQSFKAQKLMEQVVSYPKECEDCLFKYGCKGGLKCLVYSTFLNLLSADPNCPLIKLKDYNSQEKIHYIAEAAIRDILNMDFSDNVKLFYPELKALSKIGIKSYNNNNKIIEKELKYIASKIANL